MVEGANLDKAGTVFTLVREPRFSPCAKEIHGVPMEWLQVSN